MRPALARCCTCCARVAKECKVPGGCGGFGCCCRCCCVIDGEAKLLNGFFVLVGPFPVTGLAGPDKVRWADGCILGEVSTASKQVLHHRTAHTLDMPRPLGQFLLSIQDPGMSPTLLNKQLLTTSMWKLLKH
jgi:hypothetical protein